MTRTRTHTHNYLKRHIPRTSTASNKYYNLTLTENVLYFYKTNKQLYFTIKNVPKRGFGKLYQV